MARRRGRKRSLRGSKVIYDEPQTSAHGGQETEPRPESPPEKEKEQQEEQEQREKKNAKRKAKKPAKASRARAVCPVCGGPGRRRRSSATARCETCRTVFRDPPAGGEGRGAAAQAVEAREAFYERAFGRPNYEERREGKPLAKEAMSGFFRITRGKPAALNGFDKDVLEVDCGLGMRLRAFQDYGWWVTGTETSATACEYARRMSLDVKLGSLAGMLADGSFGIKAKFHLVFFCGSFGRVGDPCGAAERLREVMVPGGLVCVLREPLAGRGAKLPPGRGVAADASRLIFYTAESLRRVFCERGFSFVSEEFPPGRGGAEGTGTFWFRSKARK